MGEGLPAPLKIFAGAVIVAGAIVNPFSLPAIATAVMGGVGLTLLQEGTGIGLADVRGRLLGTDLDTQNSLPICYGNTITGSRMSFFQQERSRVNPQLPLVDADNLVTAMNICHGSSNGEGIESIQKVFIDGELAWDAASPDSNNQNTAGRLIATEDHFLNDQGESVFSYRPHLGSAAQSVDPDLNAIFPSSFPTTSRARGVAYAAMVFTLEDGGDKIYTGLPQITWEVEGAKVYDTRTDTWGYSNNPALCIYDYLTNDIYGFGIDPADIDVASFDDVADYSDELISIPDGAGGTVNVNRFECNVTLDASQDLLTNLDVLLSSCRGALIYEGGQFRLVVKRTQTPTGITYTEEDVIGDIQLSKPGTEQSPNSMEISYVDKEDNWSTKNFRWPDPSDTVFLQDDNNFKQSLSLNLHAETNRYRARHIAETVLKELRDAHALSFTTTDQALELHIGDIIEVDHDILGALSPKEFWVSSIGIAQNGLVQLSLIEYIPSAYTAPTLSDIDDNPAPPDRTADILPPTNVNLNAGLQCDGFNTQTLFSLTFDRPDSDLTVTTYEVQWKNASDTEWINVPIGLITVSSNIIVAWTPEDSQLTETNIEARVRAVYVGFGKSDWVTDTLDLTTVRSGPDASVIVGGDITETQVGGSVLMSVNVSGSNGSIFTLHVSDTTGFTPDASTAKQTVSIDPAVTTTVNFNFTPPVANGDTYFFVIEVEDCYTAIFGESSDLTSEFSSTYDGPVSTGISFNHVDHGNVGTSPFDIKWSDGWIQEITPTADITFTFSGFQAGMPLALIIHNSGGHTITFPAILWHLGSAPSILTGTDEVGFQAVGNTLSDVIGRKTAELIS